MKGKMSKDVKLILRDASARKELRNHLIHGRNGTVQVGDKTFRVNVDPSARESARKATPSQ